MTEGKPLFGWRILVTRPVEQAESLANALLDAGAAPITYPTIALGPPPDWAPFDTAAARIDSYGWIVFTSPSAVRFAVDHAEALADRLRRPGAPAVAAVGIETAKALAGYGIPVGLVPDDQRQEGLVAAFAGRALVKPVLFPQTIGGRELLRAALADSGAQVDVVPISQTIALPLVAPPPTFDVATFASPSALRAFVDVRLAKALAEKVVAVIGPTTRQAAATAGVTVHVMPSTPSVAALTGALVDYRQGRTQT
jgi:uroporphyrinogen III methyltransferase/synthase